MKITRNLIFLLTLFTLFTLYGCFEVIDRPRIDVDEAYLYTPKGKFEFIIDKKYKARLRTNGSNPYVSITLFPIDKTSYIEINSLSKHSFKINTVDSYYQLNNGGKIKLDIKGRWYNQKDYIINAPKTIDHFTVIGGALKVLPPEGVMTKLKRKHIKKMNKDTYHYYIPFTADNEKYTIDVTFRLTTSLSLKSGVPGVP